MRASPPYCASGRPHNRRVCFLLASASVLLSGLSLAQDSFSRSQFWVSGGAGLVIADNLGASGKSISLYYKPGSVVVSIRFLDVDRINAMISLDPPSPDLDHVQEFAAFVGFATDHGDGMYGISGGLGYLHGNYNELRNYTSFSVPALVVETWAILKLSGSVGIGITLLGDFNARRSFGGTLITVQIGRLRR